MSTAAKPNYIKDFLTTLLKQREACIKAETGKYNLLVIEAFNRINKDFTVVVNGRFKNDAYPYRNLFVRHEAAIRVIMFGESAKQHKKLNEKFNNAFLIANAVTGSVDNVEVSTSNEINELLLKMRNGK